MRKKPMHVEDDNVSRAWAQALLGALEPGVEALAPLVVTVNCPHGQAPPEEQPIRDALDHALCAKNEWLCNSVANTMFPWSMWHQGRDRTELYAWYQQAWPRIRRCRPNRHGTYFQRLIGFPTFDAHEPVNQLEKVIAALAGRNRRLSALQAAVFDPRQDHHPEAPRWGFPCLQQIVFEPVGDDGIAVTGFYANQYLFEKAYGNYLGLWRLACFIGHAVGRQVSRVVCVAARARRGNATKESLRPLAAQLQELLAQEAPKPGGGDRS